MVFYDFEVFKYDWLVVLINPETQREDVIINDRILLKEYFEQNEDDIWVGFNSRRYDQYILKAILLGLDPKECNDFIIVKNQDGYKFTNLFKRIQINNYDVMQNNDRGLKWFEGSMGNNIKETSVPFDINRKLTSEEIQETVKYCRHDVEQTIELFLQRYADFEAQVKLMQMFHLPLSAISKTKAQVSAMILEAKKTTFDDEFEICFPDTLRLQKYAYVKDWYEDWKNRDYEKSLETMVAGVPHVFGWGGVHGARPCYVSDGYFVNMDVASLYPNLMIRYGLLSRACNPTKFKDIVDLRLKYKAEKNPMQAPLKIVINGTYGASKDRFNPLYDPLMANNVCIHGQLLLLDLLEHLEPHCEIIQSNTDGVLVKIPDTDEAFDKIDEVAREWEQRVGLTLEFDEFKKVIQKDVNNYILVAHDGHFKTKGGYVQKLTDLTYDLPIVNKAVVSLLVDGVPVEKTIGDCDELKEFQLVKKISGKYTCLKHGDEVLSEKCVRVFASVDPEDAGLFKVHATRGTVAKVENTPVHCFIFNDEVNGVKVMSKLDKSWYMKLAQKRADDFLRKE